VQGLGQGLGLWQQVVGEHYELVVVHCVLVSMMMNDEPRKIIKRN
jgi:hypothetical protein